MQIIKLDKWILNNWLFKKQTTNTPPQKKTKQNKQTKTNKQTNTQQTNTKKTKQNKTKQNKFTIALFMVTSTASES